MQRFIGIRHRVKLTRDGDPHPTQLVIIDGVKTQSLDLETEQQELDFVRGILPVSFRSPKPDEQLDQFAAHQVKWRKLVEGEDPASFPQQLVRQDGQKKNYFVVSKVPNWYEGLMHGDTVGALFGGSGDPFLYALSRRGEEIGAYVYRTPGYRFKTHRTDQGLDPKDKTKDAVELANYIRDCPEDFYEVRARDRNLIRVRENIRLRMSAMEDRMACEQRLNSSALGQIFCSPEGKFPEGELEKAADQFIANDALHQLLVAEQKRWEREIDVALASLEVYTEVFDPIKGMGPIIAARLIAEIVDIRRFQTKAALKAFCGVHVLTDGRFVRARRGEDNNYNRGSRQALYLLGQSLVKNPRSPWGEKLVSYKQQLRQRHPAPVSISGELLPLFRTIERCFLKHGSPVRSDQFSIEDFDGLYQYVLAGDVALKEQGKDVPAVAELLQSIEELDKVGSLFRKIQLFFDQQKIEVEFGSKKITSREQLEQYLTAGVVLLGDKADQTGLNKQVSQFRSQIAKCTFTRPVSIYSAGHIHKMATWRTLTKFVEYLFKEWWALEHRTEVSRQREPRAA